MRALFPVLFLVATSALLPACDETKEVGLDDATLTGAPSATEVNPERGTVVPPPPPLPSPIAIPDDWPKYANPDIPELAFRYPRDWFGGPSPTSLYSFDPSTVGGDNFPAGGIKVEIHRVPLSAPGVPTRPPEASSTALNSKNGWEVVSVLDNANSVRRIHNVSLDVDGHRYAIIGYFADRDADERAFLEILSTVVID